MRLIYILWVGIFVLCNVFGGFSASECCWHGYSLWINTNYTFNMQTADNHFLANHQLSYWARGLYSQAMDRDAVDASDDANALALALAERLVAICLNIPIPSVATELVDSPHSSLWLIHALLQAWNLEPFKTSQEAETHLRQAVLKNSNYLQCDISQPVF